MTSVIIWILFDYNEKIALHLRFAVHFYLSSFSLDLRTFYNLSIFLVSVGTGHGFLGALFGVADLLLQVVFLVLFLFFFWGARRPVFVSCPWSGFSFLTKVAISCFVSSVPRSPGIVRPVCADQGINNVLLLLKLLVQAGLRRDTRVISLSCCSQLNLV
jgi:hypothetical protein